MAREPRSGARQRGSPGNRSRLDALAARTRLVRGECKASQRPGYTASRAAGCAGPGRRHTVAMCSCAGRQRPRTSLPGGSHGTCAHFPPRKVAASVRQVPQAVTEHRTLRAARRAPIAHPGCAASAPVVGHLPRPTPRQAAMRVRPAAHGPAATAASSSALASAVRASSSESDPSRARRHSAEVISTGVRRQWTRLGSSANQRSARAAAGW